MQQTTIQFGQVVQPSVLSRVKAAVKSFREWADARSDSFTALCGTEGDEFTHGDVLKAMLYLATVFAVMCVAGWLEGGAV